MIQKNVAGDETSDMREMPRQGLETMLCIALWDVSPPRGSRAYRGPPVNKRHEKLPATLFMESAAPGRLVASIHDASNSAPFLT